MTQYYIGQCIVHLKRYWKVIGIESDRIEIKSLRPNDKGFYRITTLYKYKELTDSDLKVLISLS